MLRLVKYLKGSIGAVLLIIVLLFLQAYCDLSLPAYTSDIVNVGIQQGGIEQAVPSVIRESEMNRLMLFMSEEERQIIQNSYTLQKPKKSYKTEENVYRLKSVDEDEKEQLQTIFGIPMILNMAMNDPDTMKSLMNNASDKMNSPVEEATEIVNDDQKMSFIAQKAKEQMAEYPEMLIDQSGIQYIKQEYQTIGIDLEALQMNYIKIAGLKMLGLALVAMIITIGIAFISSRVGAKISRDLRGRVFRKVVAFSNNEFDHFSTASLITRSTNDIQQVQMLIVMLLRMIIYAPILAIGGIVKVVNTNTKMVWILGLAVGCIFAVVAVLFVVAMPKFKLLQKLVDRLNLVSRETITGISVIRAFGTQTYEEERFDKANKDLTRTNLFVNRSMSFMFPIMMLILNMVSILIVWVGAKYIDIGSMQVGDMMAFIQYAIMIIMSFLILTMISIMLPRASVSATRIDEVLATENRILDPQTEESMRSSEKGVVRFDHVSFAYPGAEVEVLKDIDFTAMPGQTTAIIGSTGCGKSTLVSLIPRFYDVTEGKITVDGVDIRNMKKHTLRERIGYVPQKGVLFSGTIESNIKFANETMSDEDMKHSAMIAQAQEFIEEKPDKYDSHIAQGGTNVSGGQKQRLSIARAIAKKPEVYIFDDSFSALDYKTDVALRKALKEQTSDSTVIIVAQRISTILHAEQIIVLDQGRIVGIGTHKELLKSCEEYQQIASSQLSKEELENE